LAFFVFAFINLRRSQMQYSLDRAIHDAKFSPDSQSALTDHQQTEILSIIGKGCRADTKDRLSRRLRMPLALFPSYGIFSRLIIADDNDRAPYYICGQSWTDEMQTLRKLILKG
jgi:hypothetical protein